MNKTSRPSQIQRGANIIHLILVRGVMLTVIVSFLVTFSLPAQEIPQTPLDGGGETIDVSLTNLAVYVTDRKGTPVTGLGREDFKLSIDGQDIEITHFDVIRDQPLFLTVFIDNYNTNPLLRNRILEKVRPFLLRRLQQGDHVQVAVFDGKSQNLQPFTRDPDLIGSQLDNLYKTQPSRRYGHLQNRLLAFQELIDTLAGLPGRRIVLLLSDYLTNSFSPAEGTTSTDGARTLGVFSPLSRQGAPSPCISWKKIPYPSKINLPDLISRSNLDRVSVFLFNRGDTYRYGSGMSTFDDMRSSTRDDSTLSLLAERTGGQRVSWWQNAHGGLEKLNSSLNLYYSLGFRAPQSRRLSKVSVTVRGSGLRVRHRDTLFSKTLAQQGLDHALSTLIYGISTNPLSIRISSGESSVFDGDLMVLPIDLRLPIDRVVLIPKNEEGDLSGQISIFFIARDSAGQLAPALSMTKSIEVSRDRIASNRRIVSSHEMKLLFRAGVHEVAFCVRDDFGGEISCSKKEVEIPSL